MFSQIPHALLKYLALCAIIFVAACSPYVFTDEVQTFNGKIKNISTAYEETTDSIRDEGRMVVRAQLFLAPSQIKAGDQCALRATGGDPCDLTVPDLAGGSLNPVSLPEVMPVDSAGIPDGVCRPAVTPVTALGSNVKKLASVQRRDVVKSIQDYAASLAAITKAQDRADFDSAASKASAAAGGLAGGVATVTGVPGPLGGALEGLTKASGNALLWVVGQGLDYQRLQQLRIATEAACDKMHTLSYALGVMLEEQQRTRLRQLGYLLSARISIANNSRNRRVDPDRSYGGTIDDAYAVVDSWNAVRAINPLKVANALRQSHDDLVVAIRNNDGQFAALVVSLRTFAETADALIEASRKVSAAPTDKKS